MKEDNREKFAFELRLKEIQAMDKDMTSMFYKIVTGLAILIWFLFTIGYFNSKDAIVIKNLFLFGLLVLLYVCSWQNQIYKYLQDCYDGLFNSLKYDKIFEFYPETLKWYYSIYYRRRTNLNSKRNFPNKHRFWNKIFDKNHIMNYTYSYFGGVMAALAIAYTLGQNPFGYPWYSLLIFFLLTFTFGLICVTMIAFAFVRRK